MYSVSLVGKFILNWVYPNQCLHCQRIIREGNLCLKCEHQLESAVGDRIDRVPFNAGIDQAYSCWYFNAVLQSVIHDLKYRDMARIGRRLGEKVAETLGREPVAELDFLVPVPLFSVKKRSRGFNQARWIAEGMAEVWKLPVNSGIIRRRKNTVSQTTLNRDERLRNMENAFVISQPLKDRKIGIIDDVLTTGATISACARVLKQAGAAEIRAITVATPKMED